ncbi:MULTISPECIES: DUF1641 domain-containing protein [Brevibacillus]|uniref:DUF1641 domain-containing protein n=1 Tax=Brevibacillus TaxID=55080 RepID=UPI00204263FC|nr:DUF1641 domain-containing protein [Brevibacillus borstelensis]MCM3473495.1 DUF1641 domain-containing protein [Brevibacillus borstelensis]
MAKPIRDFERTEPTPEERQTEAVTAMIKALADNREAVLDTLDILHHLHRLGILAAVKSLLERSHEVGAIAVQQFNQPKMHNTVKNVITATQALGNIHPEHVQRLLHGVAQGLESSTKATAEGHAPTLWEMMKIMRDPAVRASMATMLGLAKGMGEAFQKESPHVH